MRGPVPLAPMRTLEQPIHRGIDVGWPLVVPVTSLDGWTNASSVDAAAFDEVTLVNGALTISDPSDGANNLADDGAAHGMIFMEFPGYGTDYKLGCYWSGIRPAEGTPIAAVDLGEPEGGLGLYPGHDLIVGVNGDESVWALSEIGDSNANFAIRSVRGLTAAEFAKYNDATETRAWMEIYVVGTRYWAVLDGVYLGVEATVPVSLRGGTVHGIAIDNNQCTVTPDDTSAPFPRTPDVPAAYGPLLITKL